MRYVLGVLFFGGLVIFVTPVTVVGMLSPAQAPRSVMGLVNFALGAAVVFGIPGYFAFPYERRLQALGWLALACLAYGSFLVAVLSFIRANPAMLTDPEARAFYAEAGFHYGYFAVVALAEAGVFLALFRRRRVRDTFQAEATPPSMA